MTIGALHVATEKQIAANRANAKRSTGPKTAAGKRRSSGNAFRHGLSGAMPDDEFTLAAIDAVTRVVADAILAGIDGQPDAAAFARSRIELRRIRAVRTDLSAALDPEHPKPKELRRLAALDRYERLAQTKSRRARRGLEMQSTLPRQQDQSK
jgi:hypothetical protein